MSCCQIIGADQNYEGKQDTVLIKDFVYPLPIKNEVCTNAQS